MSDRKPQKHDRVRLVLEGVVTDLDDHGDVAMFQGDGEQRAHYVPRPFSVEVLEPADDPSSRPVGTVMRGTEDTSRSNVVVRIEVAPHAKYQWCSVTGGAWYEHDDLIGFEVIGVVPGTPAAENDPADFVRQIQQAQRREGESDEEYIARLKALGFWHETEVVPAESLFPEQPTPPASAYSRHLRHIAPEAGCEYCPPEQVQP